MDIIVHLGPKEIDAAVAGLENNPVGVRSLDEFKTRLPVRSKDVVVNWLVQRKFLDLKTVGKTMVVDWTEKGAELKKKNSKEIKKELTRLNEGCII